MPNQIGTDILSQLHSQDDGYVQAVANAAYLIVSRVDDMFNEMMGGEPDRFNQYIEAVIESTDDMFAALLNPDIQALDYIAEEIVPVISDTYKVELDDVTADMMVLTDYYAMVSLLDDV